MMYLIITLVTVGLMLPFAIMFLICGADKKHKIGGFVACLCIGLVVGGAISLQTAQNKSAWNNGVCDCGTKWELSAVSEGRHGTVTKYYTCDNCKTEIVIKN